MNACQGGVKGMNESHAADVCVVSFQSILYILTLTGVSIAPRIEHHRQAHRPAPLFRQLYEAESSTYTYFLADPESAYMCVYDVFVFVSVSGC